MKKWTLSIVSILVMLTLVACGNENSQDDHAKHNSTDSTEPLKVKLEVPKEAKQKEKVKISAVVTQGDKKVKKADEVKFEIIKDGDKNTSKNKVVKENQEGIYTLEYTFDEKGKYNVTSHVTANDQHTMPNKDIEIK